MPMSMPMLSGPASTLKSCSRPAAFRPFTTARKAAVTRWLTSTLPAAVWLGNRIEPPLMLCLTRQSTSASPPIAAAEASCPVWLMLLRSYSVGS